MHYWQPLYFPVAVDRWIDTTPPGMNMVYGWGGGTTDLFLDRWLDIGTVTRGFDCEC